MEAKLEKKINYVIIYILVSFFKRQEKKIYLIYFKKVDKKRFYILLKNIYIN